MGIADEQDGAENGENGVGEPTSLDDESVIKQNMNAIENYKRYVDSVKDLRQGRYDGTSYTPTVADQ